MDLLAGRNIEISKLTIGEEKSPLLVIDNFVENPDCLAELAARLNFSRTFQYYPGIRAPAPKAFEQLIRSDLQSTILEYFELDARTLEFSGCDYSLVTTEPKQLNLYQRIPHFDSLDGDILASIYYLFKGEQGGTSFYRHRKTGYEYLDESRKHAYAKSLEGVNGTADIPPAAYINGDTPLFERIAEQQGIFNRLIIYRGNSLHSGSISGEFNLDPNPLTGRLTITSFIDPVA
ncbi:MAG: DUF6445 family protein [Pseudomonadales bacterium]